MLRPTELKRDGERLLLRTWEVRTRVSHSSGLDNLKHQKQSWVLPINPGGQRKGAKCDLHCSSRRKHTSKILRHRFRTWQTRAPCAEIKLEVLSSTSHRVYMQVKCGPLNWGDRNHHIPLFWMSFLWGLGYILQRPWLHRSSQLFATQNWPGFIYRIWRLCLRWSDFHYTHIWNSLSRSWRFIACHLLGQGSGKCLPRYSLRWTLDTETLYIQRLLYRANKRCFPTCSRV